MSEPTHRRSPRPIPPALPVLALLILFSALSVIVALVSLLAALPSPWYTTAALVGFLPELYVLHFALTRYRAGRRDGP